MPESARVKYQLSSWVGSTVALNLTAINPFGDRPLVTLGPVTAGDSYIKAVVQLNGNFAQVLLFDKKVNGAWVQSSAQAVFTSDGTYHVVLLLTGNATNSEVVVVSDEKQ